jgi:hypothetical protein
MPAGTYVLAVSPYAGDNSLGHPRANLVDGGARVENNARPVDIYTEVAPHTIFVDDGDILADDSRPTNLSYAELVDKVLAQFPVTGEHEAAPLTAATTGVVRVEVVPGVQPNTTHPNPTAEAPKDERVAIGVTEVILDNYVGGSVTTERSGPKRVKELSYGHKGPWLVPSATDRVLGRGDVNCLELQRAKQRRFGAVHHNGAGATQHSLARPHLAVVGEQAMRVHLTIHLDGTVRKVSRST